MTEVEDSNVRLKRHQAFLATELGQLYGAMKDADRLLATRRRGRRQADGVRSPSARSHARLSH